MSKPIDAGNAFEAARGSPYTILEKIVSNPSSALMTSFDVLENIAADPESPQLEWLHQDSGYILKPLGHGPESLSEEEKNELEARKAIAQNAMVSGLMMTMDEVYQSFDIALSALDNALNKPLTAVTADDMLYVDAQGRPVPAGTPGAQQVSTAEEKAAIEDQLGACLPGLTAEDTTKVDGLTVPREAAENRMTQEEILGELERAQTDIEAGRVKPEDLPPYIQDLLKEAHETGGVEIAEPSFVSGGILFTLPGEDAAMEKAENYLEQSGSMPAPARTQAYTP